MKKMTFFKFRKAFYLFAVLFCFGLFCMNIATAIHFKDVDMIVRGLPCLVYTLLFFALYMKEKELHKHIRGGAMLMPIINGMAHDLHRYETLYGKLLEEEPKQETNESERTDESKD